MKEEISQIEEKINSLLLKIKYELSHMINDESLSEENKEYKKELIEYRYKLKDCLDCLI